MGQCRGSRKNDQPLDLIDKINLQQQVSQLQQLTQYQIENNIMIFDKTISNVSVLNQDLIIFFYKNSTIGNIFDVVSPYLIAQLDIGKDFHQDNCYALSQDKGILAIHDKNSFLIFWNIETKNRVPIDINFTYVGCVDDCIIGYKNQNIITISFDGQYTQNLITKKHFIMKLVCNRITFFNETETIFIQPKYIKQKLQRIKQKIKYNQIHALSYNMFCVLTNNLNRFFIQNHDKLKIIRKIKQPVADDQYQILGVGQGQIFFRIISTENDFILWTSNLALSNKFNHINFQNTISESVIQNKYIFFKHFVLTWEENQFRRVFYK